MDGLVLNFDAGQDEGLIRAGDGKRYSFKGAEWKSASVPRLGDIVDFEVEEGTATGIYLVRSDAPAPQAAVLATPMETPPPPPPPPAPANAFRGNIPALVFAALIPLSFFLPWFSGSGLSISYWDLLGGVSLADFLPGHGGGGALVILTYFFCALPAYAAWLVVQELRGASTSRLRTNVGLLGLAVPLTMTVAAFTPLAQTGASLASLLSVLGTGWIMLILLSIGLIAVGCGWPPFTKDDAIEADAGPGTHGHEPRAFEPSQEETWADDAFAEEERQRRNALLSRLGQGAEVAAILCFMLPWVTFSYAARITGTASGLDLLTGRLVVPGPLGGMSGRVAAGPALAVILAILLIAVSIFLAQAWEGRKRAFAQVVGCGGAAVLLLVELFILLPQSLTGQTAQLGNGPAAGSFAQVAPLPLQAGPNGGFWLTLVALAAAIVVNWMVLRDEGEPAE